MLGPDGQVQRSVQFSTIDVGDAPTRSVDAPARRRRRDGEGAVVGARRLPRAASLAGFELVTRSQHPDGVLLFYSDGVFTASVFEQQGDLDWGALPSGGTDSRLADTRTRTYHEPSGDVVVWERNGLVYTCVTDAPSDVFAAMVERARRPATAARPSRSSTSCSAPSAGTDPDATTGVAPEGRTRTLANAASPAGVEDRRTTPARSERSFPRREVAGGQAP